MQDILSYRGADVYSDHHLAIAKLKIKLKRQKKKILLSKRFDVAKLKNSEVLERFQASIQNHFDAITDPMPVSTGGMS